MLFYLNLISQLSGLLSGVLLFMYGIPSMTEHSLYDCRTTDISDVEEQKRNSRFIAHKNKSRVGLSLLIFSFLLQIIILFLTT